MFERREQRKSEPESLDDQLRLDRGRLAELRALDPDGRARLLPRVLLAYQTSLDGHVEDWRRARRESAWKKVSEVAHALKSSSASVGAMRLARLCAEIESLLRQGDRERAAPLLDRFGVEAEQAGIAVRRELAECTDIVP
jgi:hypothetical protein